MRKKLLLRIFRSWLDYVQVNLTRYQSHDDLTREFICVVVGDHWGFVK